MHEFNFDIFVKMARMILTETKDKTLYIIPDIMIPDNTVYNHRDCIDIKKFEEMVSNGTLKQKYDIAQIHTIYKLIPTLFCHAGRKGMSPSYCYHYLKPIIGHFEKYILTVLFAMHGYRFTYRDNTVSIKVVLNKKLFASGLEPDELAKLFNALKT